MYFLLNLPYRQATFLLQLPCRQAANAAQQAWMTPPGHTLMCGSDRPNQDTETLTTWQLHVLRCSMHGSTANLSVRDAVNIMRHAYRH